jgi:glycosyltransferase involved in cell wall biosynthesis
MECRRLNSVVIVGIFGFLLFVSGLVLPRIVKARDVPVAPLADERADAELPIRVIIAAYLESGVIGATIGRLRDQLALDVNPESDVLVIASDEPTASAARTAGAFVVVQDRRGKAAALNSGVALSQGHIILLTDANTEILPQDWPARLRSDLSRIDLVSATKEETGSKEDAYWALERSIKARTVNNECQQTLAVVGEFVGFRYSDWRDIPARTVIDDFQIALSFSSRGLVVGVDTGIRVLEPATTGIEQWGRRIRISSGVISEGLRAAPELFRTSVGRAFLAHKVYRQTIGAVGFWIAVVCLSLFWPPYSLTVVIIGVALCVTVYTSRWRVSRIVEAVATGISLQLVPIFGALSAVRRLWRRGAGNGWRKVKR